MTSEHEATTRMEAPPDLSSNDDVGLAPAVATGDALPSVADKPLCAGCGEPARYLVSGRAQPEAGVCGAHLEGAMNQLDPATVRMVPGVTPWARGYG